MTTAMPVSAPAVGVYQELLDQSSAPIKRKWTGRGLEKQPAYENGSVSVRPPKQEQQSGTNAGLNSFEKATTRGRQNSLRHVKNSNEVLRQRSANRGHKDVAPDGTSGGREGRQFTVANVGNNGRIYLRYDCITNMTAQSHRAILVFEAD